MSGIDPYGSTMPQAQSPSSLARSSGAQRQHHVAIAAYAQMGFGEEMQLDGEIGQQLLLAEARSTRTRSIHTRGSIGGEEISLSVHLRPMGPMPAKGYVIGQKLSGKVKVSDGQLFFDGMAGDEELHYKIDRRGICSNRGQDLGVRVVYQSYYSEVVGSIDRIPDALVIALLMPVAVRKHDRT